MAAPAMTQAEAYAFTRQVETAKAEEGHQAKWVYPSMAASAWGITEEFMGKLILDEVVPSKVVTGTNQPRIVYVDAACAPIKNADALRWGRAEPEHISYKVAQPVHAAAADVMKTPQWDELVKRYDSGERWTDRTQELLDTIGDRMEKVLPNSGQTAGINGILLHAVHTNDAGEAIRIIRALGTKRTRVKDKDDEENDGHGPSAAGFDIEDDEEMTDPDMDDSRM